MSPGGRQFARTYAFALVGLVVVGFLALYATSIMGALAPDYGAPRPSPAQKSPYALTYRVGNEPDATMLVGEEGHECDALAASEVLGTACVLALQIDPAFIAAEAFGRLNNEETPSGEAMIWRAVLDADPSVCERGGLLENRLAACRAAALKGTYRRSDHGVVVSVSSTSR